MSGSFTAIYSTAQRVAVVTAFDPPVVTSRQVAELAGAGKLVDADGRRLAPFVIPPGTVRSLARRSRRGDAALGDREREQMYDAMSRRARRLAAKARTPQEVALWAKALRDVERLGAQRAKSPAPSGPSTLGRSILDAHTGGGVYTPPLAPPERTPESAVVDPPPVPEPAPEPKAAPLPQTPGEWMREQVAALAPPPAPVPVGGSGDGHPDATLMSATPAAMERYGGKRLPSVKQDRSRQRIGGMPGYCYPPG
jgi:hypothetical protein